MEILSIIGLIILAVVVWVVAKFVLKLTARVAGCAVTGLVAVGLLFLLWLFFLK
jgi:hypothetical protein